MKTFFEERKEVSKIRWLLPADVVILDMQDEDTNSSLFST